MMISSGKTTIWINAETNEDTPRIQSIVNELQPYADVLLVEVLDPGDSMVITLLPVELFSVGAMDRTIKALALIREALVASEVAADPQQLNLLSEPYDFDALRARCNKIPAYTETRRPIIPPEADPLLE